MLASLIMTTQVSTHAHFCVNNWFNFYKMNPDLTVSNAHLQELHFSSLADCGEPFDSFCNLACEEGVFILSVAPNGWVLQVFHRANLVGGTYARTVKILVTIIGFDCHATPVEFEIDNSIVDVDEQVPSWDLLSDPTIDNIAKFKGLNVMESFDLQNMVGIPNNVLTRTFLNAQSKDPISIGFLFHAAMLDFDEANEANASQESFSESGYHISQFCWLAAHDKIPCLTYSISEDAVVLRWCQDKHELNI